jgi:hypothetical protein
MPAGQLIIAEEFCASHGIEIAFINSLQEFGLIEITVVEEKPFIAESQLQKLEKLMRMHYDLQINLEGIDAIANLLERLNAIQEENKVLRSRLHIYEETDFRDGGFASG